jgi:copper transport protein
VKSHTNRLLRRVSIVAALVVLVTPALLFAHAHLERSEPAEGARLKASPTEIKLWFSEKPDINFSKIELRGAHARMIQVGAISAIEKNGFRVPLPQPLEPAAYMVLWRTAASDGHASNGVLRFVVTGDSSAATTPAAPAVIAAPPPAQNTLPRAKSNAVVTPASTVSASTGLRWAEFIALLSIIGAIIFRLVVVPGAKWPDELTTDANDRVRRLAIAFAVLFVLSTLTRGLAQSQMLSQTYFTRMAAMHALVTTTRWGLAWLIGVIGAVVVFIGLLIARAGLAGWIIAAVGVVAVTMSEGLTGHSGASQHVSLAMAMDVAHQLGAGGWLGGLACVVIAGLPAAKRLGDPESRFAGMRLVRAYHASALECVALVLVTGLVAGALRLHAISDLWTTPYGSMLFRKLVFVAGVLGFGYFHWRRIVIPEWDADTRFRFARSAAFELIVGAVVVAFTALLVSTQLP